MKIINKLFIVIALFTANLCLAQPKDSMLIAAMVKEANEHSQLEIMANELMNGIGPRLVGSPKMLQAHD